MAFQAEKCSSNGALRFGKRVNFETAHHRLDLTHIDGPDGFAPMERAAQGVCTTRFKKGFNRRNQSVICPHVERKATEKLKAHEAAEHFVKRREYLLDKGHYNGFNVISGQYDPQKIRGRRLQARYLSDRPSTELVKSGEITIRNSHYRFYTPLPSGNEHDRRQQQLVTEGLLKPKCSSVLGIGRADVQSYGVEDQFSHSQYQQNPIGGREGLVEWTEPGRFTPRKTGVAKNRPFLFAGTWREDAS
tara:strand:+ start:1279 stop:2016 length:738 start_codon:yes stop_codon:yes gene_type:complete